MKDYAAHTRARSSSKTQRQPTKGSQPKWQRRRVVVRVLWVCCVHTASPGREWKYYHSKDGVEYYYSSHHSTPSPPLHWLVGWLVTHTHGAAQHPSL